MTTPGVPDPADRLSVGDIIGRHPESVRPPRSGSSRPVPRWKAYVDFGFLLLVALGGLALALWFAVGAVVVGTGLGGERVHVVDVHAAARGGPNGRIDAPAALAGHAVAVDADHDGTFYVWPSGGPQAWSRGWGFLASDWLAVLGALVCLIAVVVIVRALVRLRSRAPDEG